MSWPAAVRASQRIPYIGRSHSRNPFKGSAKMSLVTKAKMQRNFNDRSCGCEQLVIGPLNSHATNVVPNGCPIEPSERTSHMHRVNPDLGCESRQVDIFRETIPQQFPCALQPVRRFRSSRGRPSMHFRDGFKYESLQCERDDVVGYRELVVDAQGKGGQSSTAESRRIFKDPKFLANWFEDRPFEVQDQRSRAEFPSAVRVTLPRRAEHDRERLEALSTIATGLDERPLEDESKPRVIVLVSWNLEARRVGDFCEC